MIYQDWRGLESEEPGSLTLPVLTKREPPRLLPPRQTKRLPPLLRQEGSQILLRKEGSFLVPYSFGLQNEKITSSIYGTRSFCDRAALFRSVKAMEYNWVFVVIGVTAALLLSAKVQKDVNDKGGCPNCGTHVPRVRHPTSWRQALWGGWTCSNCGTEMDRFGNELQRN